MVSAKTARVLARCNGFRVEAGGQLVGAVATPVFSGGSLLPEYLLVRVGAAIPGIFRAVPPDLVSAADAASETLVLKLAAAEVASLPVPDVLERGSATPPLLPRTDTTKRESANRDDAWTLALDDYRTLLRHRIATPLTVIRGSAVTLRDLPGLRNEEVKQLADAIERATQDLERAALDPLLFERE
jgi:signal transduction histidine kinase